MNERPRFSGPVPRPGSRLQEHEPSNAELAGRLEAGLSGLATRLEDGLAATEARLGDRIGVVHAEVVMLRQTVHGDHATRITAVERHRTLVPPAAAKAGKYTAVALAIPALLQLAAQLKPNLAGPLQTLIQIFQ